MLPGVHYGQAHLADSCVLHLRIMQRIRRMDEGSCVRLTVTIERTETIVVNAKDEAEARQKAEIILNLRNRYNCHHWDEEE